MSETEEHKSQNDAPEEVEGHMGFFEHLEELRKRIVWAVVWLLVGCAAGWFMKDFVVDDVLFRPLLEIVSRHSESVGEELSNQQNAVLQNLSPMGVPFFYFKIVLVVGFVLAFPMILYQLWLFVGPGLYDSERSWAGKITVFTSICFLTGIAFAYFAMMPLMLNFAFSWEAPNIQTVIEINEYFSFMITIVLSAGLVFELPMIIMVLARVGLVTPEFLRKYRRHAIVLILIIAAILTPTPDPVGQLTFGIPVMLLYELSIIIAKFVRKKAQEADQPAVS